jgi:hypothetical protein
MIVVELACCLMLLMLHQLLRQVPVLGCVQPTHQMMTLSSALPDTTTPEVLKRAALTHPWCPSHTATERLSPCCQQRSTRCFHLHAATHVSNCIE